MDKIVVFANQKGGCGKTTLAINVAGAAAESGKTTLVVDADPQGTVNRWASSRASPPPFEVKHHTRSNFHELPPNWTDPYDMVLIDCPPGGHSTAEHITRSALAVAHLVVVPFQPSAFDLWSAQDMASMIQKVREQRPRLKAALVTCRAVTGTVVGRDAHQAAVQIGLDVFDTVVHQRIAFVEAALAGQTIIEYAPESAAADETRALLKEIVSWLRR